MGSPKRLLQSVVAALGAAPVCMLFLGVLADTQKTADAQEVRIITSNGETKTLEPGNIPASVPPHIREKMMQAMAASAKEAQKKDDDSKKDEENKGKKEADASKHAKEADDKPNSGKEDKEGKEGKEGEKEPSEPIRREEKPPKPADPKELEVRPDEQGKVFFNFTGQKWPDVLQWLADISNKSLDWQELPADYLNLTTQRAYDLDETRDLINRHLLARGYTLLSQDDIFSVAKVEALDPGLVPRVAPEELEKRQPHEYVKTSFQLDWLLAETAAEELKEMLSPNGKLVPLKTTNRLEAMDAVANLTEIFRLLREEQSDIGQERLVEKFVLQYTRADEVLTQLQALLGLESKSSGSSKSKMSPDQMRQQQEAMRRAAEQAKKKGGAPAKPKSEVYLVANARDNSIVAHAPPDKMAVIGEAVEAIDVPSGRAHSLLKNMERMQVYRLENVDPKAVIETLEESGDLDFDTKLEADDAHNAIVAYASLADHLTIRAIVGKLDDGGRRFEVIQLTELRAESVVKIVDFMMGGGKEEEEKSSSQGRRSYYPFFSYGRSPSSRKDSDDHEDAFRVDADPNNNALLLWCNDFELTKVNDLLDNLRTVPRGENDSHSARVHRLVTLDPEPFVKTLEEMETLDFHTRLEVDQENRAIIAYASEPDHEKIRELIEVLDGSSREFHVIALKRLEADYVAGTIEFMMAGKDEKQSSGYSRTYNTYYGMGPSRDKKDSDEFRVDADIEFNRLLLWANGIEIEEVTNLLVKLGEIPPEGGDPSTVRLLDLAPGPETEQLLEQIRRAWPSLAPNELVIEPAKESKGKTPQDEHRSPNAKSEAETKPEEPAKPDPRKNGEDDEDTQPAEPESKTPPAESQEVSAEAADMPVAARTAEVPSDAKARLFHFAQLEQAAQDGAQTSTSGESSSAKSPDDPPPVSISRAPDGRLILSSDDAAALDQLEELMAKLAPPRSEFQVFQLQYAEAYWVALNLEDFFEEGKKGGGMDNYWAGWYGYPPQSSNSGSSSRRLSRRRPLRFIADDTTNTILVQGASADQLRTVEDLIELYDQRPMTDSDSARRTEVYSVRYSKAAVIAETVKEVYRDLLSDNDKALISGRQQKEQRPESRYTYVFGGSSTSDDENGQRRVPRFKGHLSIGVDSVSNTLILSAPEFLFDDILQIVEKLDQAAIPTDTVQVVQLGRGVSAARVQEVLGKLLREKAKLANASKRPSPEKANPKTAGANREKSN